MKGSTILENQSNPHQHIQGQNYQILKTNKELSIAMWGENYWLEKGCFPTAPLTAGRWRNLSLRQAMKGKKNQGLSQTPVRSLLMLQTKALICTWIIHG